MRDKLKVLGSLSAVYFGRVLLRAAIARADGEGGGTMRQEPHGAQPAHAPPGAAPLHRHCLSTIREPEAVTTRSLR